MAGTGAGDLYAAAGEFFEVCLAALEDTIGGVPDCRYIAPGPPAWDTIPSLIVHVGGAMIGDTFPLQPSLAPGHRIAQTGEVNLIPFVVTILRCAPVLTDEGQLPAAEVFDTVAQETTSDLWAIWNHLRQAKSDGSLFAPVEREFWLDPAVAVNQQGGACGWQITVRTSLDGYTPSVGVPPLNGYDFVTGNVALPDGAAAAIDAQILIIDGQGP